MFNKKSQAGATLTLGAAIILIVFLFTMFLWAIDGIVKFKGLFGERNIVVKMADSFNSMYSLKSYLYSPLEVGIDGKKESITITDLIRVWNIYNDANYRNILQSETDRIFQPYIRKEKANVYCYYLEIKNSISKTESIHLGDRRLSNLNEKAVVEIPITEGKTTTASLIINSLCLK